MSTSKLGSCYTEFGARTQIFACSNIVVSFKISVLHGT